MQREEFKTDVGRLVFDYSPIKKLVLPESIFNILLDKFLEQFEINNNNVEVQMIRQEFTDHPVFYLVTVQAKLDLDMYTSWRSTFSLHGYNPPVLQSLL